MAPKIRDTSNALATGPDDSEMRVKEDTDEYMKVLNSLVHSREELKVAGYVISPLTNVDIESKRRCMNCGVRCGYPSIDIAKTPSASR